MKLKYFALAAALCLIVGCKERGEKTEISPRTTVGIDKAAVVEPLFEDLEGKQLSLADYKGKRIFLNYWATWCRPCIEEMPALVRTREILEKENYVFLLASDQPITTIKAFKEKRNFDFMFIHYKGALVEQQISALPTTYIYNEVGERVEKITGMMNWDSPEMIQKLKAIH